MKIKSALMILLLSSILVGCGKKDTKSSNYIQVYNSNGKLIKTNYNKDKIAKLSKDIGYKAGMIAGKNESISIPSKYKVEHTLILKQKNNKASNKIKTYDGTRYVKVSANADFPTSVSWKLNNKELKLYKSIVK